MWTDNLDEKMRKSLNKLLVEVSKEKELYECEKNSSRVQMWIALALLNSKFDDLNLKIERIMNPQRTSKLKKSLRKL